MEDSAEVKAVLKALIPKIMACGEPFTAQAIGNALYGLQKMEDSTEVKAVLKALIPKIMACGEEIPAYVCYLILEFNNQFHLNLEQEVNIFNKISTSVIKRLEELNSTLSNTSNVRST